MRLWSESLVARLVISFLFLFLLAVSGGGYFTFTRARATLQESVFARLELAATLKEEELRQWLQNQEEDVIFLSQAPEMLALAGQFPRGDDNQVSQLELSQEVNLELNNYLNLYLKWNPDLGEIFVMSEVGGKILASTNPAYEGDYRVQDTYFIQGLEHTFVQKMYPWPITLEPTITISTPIHNARGERVGVLAANLNLEYMDRILLDRTGLGQTGETYLVDRYNIFVSAQGFGREDYPRGVHTVGIDAAGAGENGQGLYANYAGVPVVGVYRWVDALGVALLAEIHQTEAYLPAGQLFLTVLVAGGIMAIFLAAGVFLLARQIARPVLAITAAALRVAGGDLSQTAPVLTRDEVGVLAAAFNEMTSQLRGLYGKLQSSEAYFRSIFNAATDAFFIHDGESGSILEVNQRTCEMYGYASEEFPALRVNDISAGYPPYAQEQALEWIARSRSAGPQRFEWLAKRRDGSLFWCDINMRSARIGEKNLVLVLVRDISGRKQAEESLRLYAKRLEILRQVDQAILTAQSSQAVAAVALEQMQSLLSYQRASVLIFPETGSAPQVLAMRSEQQAETSPTAPQCGPALLARLQHGEVIFEDDMLHLAQAHPALRAWLLPGTLSVLMVPLIAQENLIGAVSFESPQAGAWSAEDANIAHELAGILAVAMKQARLMGQIEQYAGELEQRVVERTAELEAKAQELETLAASVSHDLKAPLRGIDGYSRLLFEKYEDQFDEEALTFLIQIRQGTQQMHRLINDLLTYLNLERRPLAVEPVDLKDLITAVVTEFEDEINRRGASLEMKVPPVQVMAEKAGLWQSLSNLLDNSLKFTRDVLDPKIEIGAQREGRLCVLWVKDNGIGFEMRFHDRIFRLFHRLVLLDEYAGTGIGLALVLKAMQRIGGRTWAESTPGEGATFYLEIPLADDQG